MQKSSVLMMFMMLGLFDRILLFRRSIVILLRFWMLLLLLQKFDMFAREKRFWISGGVSVKFSERMFGSSMGIFVKEVKRLWKFFVAEMSVFRLLISLEWEHKKCSESCIIFSRDEMLILEKFFFFLLFVYSWYFSSQFLMMERFSVIFLRDLVS